MESCRWCGAPIFQGTVYCPSCGVRLRRESTKCPQCKGEIRFGLAICPHCGEELARRRIPWKLIGSLGGIALAAVVVYAVVTLLPLPVNLPFVTAPPSPTATEVIVPPTATPTETPRPPTATPTKTATFTPVITATATTTSVAATAPAESRVPTGTPTAAPTETPALRYPAPRLIEPVDESGLPEDQYNFTFGSAIALSWESVGALAEDEWYSVSLKHVDGNRQTQETVNWTRETRWEVPQEYYEQIGSDRSVSWSVTVASGTPGTGEGVPISPPSEAWMFRWG